MNAVKKVAFLTYEGAIYSKKNSKRIITNARTGKPQIISSGNAKNQEIEMIWTFNEQLKNQDWEVFEKDPKEYEGRIFEVDATIFQPDRKRRDLDNQLTAILDGLVSAFALPDDSNRFVQRVQAKNGGVDRENPRAEIQLREIENVGTE